MTASSGVFTVYVHDVDIDVAVVARDAPDLRAAIRVPLPVDIDDTRPM